MLSGSLFADIYKKSQARKVWDEITYFIPYFNEAIVDDKSLGMGT